MNCVNDFPQLLRCDTLVRNNWIKLKLVGTKSNRSAIGARVYCKTGEQAQMDEVRSGGSYLSQNDLRIHFGLAKAERADIEIHWPSGRVDRISGLAANRIHRLIEGRGTGE